MAIEVRHFTFTIPAGTPVNTPFSQQQSFAPRVITQINIRVPPGPAGQMGFSIGSAGQPVLPIEANTWITTDDQAIEWPLENFWDSGSWEFFGYNLGQYDHSIYLTFLCDLPTTAPPQPLSLAPLAALSAPSGVPIAPGSTGTPTGSNIVVPPLPPVVTPTAPGEVPGPVAPPLTIPPPPVIVPPGLGG